MATFKLVGTAVHWDGRYLREGDTVDVPSAADIPEPIRGFFEPLTDKIAAATTTTTEQKPTKPKK